MTTPPLDTTRDEELREKLEHWYGDWNVEPMPSRPLGNLQSLINQEVRFVLDRLEKENYKAVIEWSEEDGRIKALWRDYLGDVIEAERKKYE